MKNDMKNLIIILVILTGQNLYSQEFVFNLYFQDSKGNSDTITLGYDMTATDSIDSSQNEHNIYNKPLDSVFDVRISNLWNKIEFDDMVDSFQTKRQIVKDNCGSWFPPVTIDIFCENWPVTIKWDSAIFIDNCNIGSILTSFHPGGWFDVGGGFITELSLTSSMTIPKFIPQDYSTYENSTQYFYLNDKNDTIYVFWQAFGDSTLPHLAVDEFKSQSDYSFYPNPSNGLFSLTGDMSNIIGIDIFDLTGKKVLTSKTNTLDLQQFSDGVYIAVIKLKSDKIINRKIINTR